MPRGLGAAKKKEPTSRVAAGGHAGRGRCGGGAIVLNWGVPSSKLPTLPYGQRLLRWLPTHVTTFASARQAEQPICRFQAAIIDRSWPACLWGVTPQ